MRRWAMSSVLALSAVVGCASRTSVPPIPAYAPEAQVMVEEGAPLGRWIKVENPWHHFGRQYNRNGGKLVAVVEPRGVQDRGISVVELSDIMRYFVGAAWVER